MDVAILGIFIIALFFLLAIGLRLQKGIYFLFAGLIGLGLVVQLLLDGLIITYISSGTTVDVGVGAYFLLVPILMTIISFLALITVPKGGSE